VYPAEKVVAIDHTWHKTCFACGGTTADGCKKVLTLHNYVDHAGDPYCKACHGRLFGPKGFHAGISATGISTQVVGEEPVSARVPEKVEGSSAPSTASGGRLSFLTSSAPKCTVCDKSVFAAEKVVAIDRTWHKTCFACGGTTADGCKKVLALHNYVDHAGDPYCKACHGRLFGPKGFHAGISATGISSHVDKAVVSDS
jgi:cysteine/glycine-rich protein